MTKVAVATTSGQEIDGQLGQAPSFNIYEVADDGSFRLLERRPVTLLRIPDGDSDEIVELLRDVSAVLARRIGSEAISAFLRKGIHAFPIFGAVDQALMTYGRGQKLLDRLIPAEVSDLH